MNYSLLGVGLLLTYLMRTLKTRLTTFIVLILKLHSYKHNILHSENSTKIQILWKIIVTQTEIRKK